MTNQQAQTQQRQFYLFVCSHSFLIGIFPFFLPVYLYKQGLNMSEISLFIALSAAVFSLSMYLWDAIKSKLTPRQLLVVCYVLELLLIFSFIATDASINQSHYLAYFIAACYGLYQCFFWTTQRALFIQRSDSDNTGDRYGNFQIFVVVFLKAGVFIGGLLLDKENTYLLFLVCVITVLVGIIAMLKIPGELHWPFLQWPRVSLKEIYRFKDKYRSKEIFALDGFFLFLESFFWLLSLFLILKQSFMQLGLMIIAITIALSLVFLVLKSRIDKLPEQLVYIISIAGYGLSWLLRANLNEELSLFYQFVFLCLIAFLTALFRLAFNKRYFDLAVHAPSTPYVLMKSYYSQGALVLFFLALSIVFNYQDTLTSLNTGYWLALLLTPLYLIYRTRATKK